MTCLSDYISKVGEKDYYKTLTYLMAEILLEQEEIIEESPGVYRWKNSGELIVDPRPIRID